MCYTLAIMTERSENKTIIDARTEELALKSSEVTQLLTDKKQVTLLLFAYNATSRHLYKLDLVCL